MAASRTQPRILLAEDEPVNKEVILGMLTLLEQEVEIVENGRQAVDAALKHPYDLIFMDCQMPEMDGLTATAEIRRQQSTGHRPKIIALTAHALPSDRDACLAAGMDDYLSKPVQIAELKRVLTRWLTHADQKAA